MSDRFNFRSQADIIARPIVDVEDVRMIVERTLRQADRNVRSLLPAAAEETESRPLTDADCDDIFQIAMEACGASGLVRVSDGDRAAVRRIADGKSSEFSPLLAGSIAAEIRTRRPSPASEKPRLTEWHTDDVGGPCSFRYFAGSTEAAITATDSSWSIWRRGSFDPIAEGDALDLASAKRAADLAAPEWYELPTPSSDFPREHGPFAHRPENARCFYGRKAECLCVCMPSPPSAPQSAPSSPTTRDLLRIGEEMRDVLEDALGDLGDKWKRGDDGFRALQRWLKLTNGIESTPSAPLDPPAVGLAETGPCLKCGTFVALGNDHCGSLTHPIMTIDQFRTLKEPAPTSEPAPARCTDTDHTDECTSVGEAVRVAGEGFECIDEAPVRESGAAALVAPSAPVLRCGKCGSAEVWTRHRIADAEYPCHRRDLAAPTDRPRCERKDEHLDRGCRNCGHRWSADVLDREPASGAGSDEASRALSVSTPKAEMRDARERLESPCEKTGRDMVRLTAALGMEIGEWPQFVDEMVAKIGALKDVFRAATELRLACVTDGETHQRVRNIEVRALCSALDALDDRPAAQSRKNGATFADAIRSALSTRGMTQADLAAVVGSAPSVVSRALADGANPTLDTVTVYARAVGLRVAFVASESPPAPTGEVGEVLEVLRSCDGTDPEFGEQARRAIATVEGLRTFRDTVLAAMGLDDGDPTAEETAEWIERLAKSEAEKRATVERLQCEREAHRREYDQLRADLATVTRDRDDAQKHFESAAQAHDKLLAEVAARDEQIARLTTRLEEAEALLAYSQHARECRDSDPCRFYVAGGAPFPSKNCTAGQRLAAAAKTGTEEQGK